MVKIYRVGGCIRDELLGLKPKDIDYAVEADSYQQMKEYIEKKGTIFLETEKYFTIRAKLNNSETSENIAADFTLCRKEREYTNNRHPDIVEVGSLYEDISRRDFTVNAIAKDEDGNLIDYFDGVTDLENRVLRCVRDTRERLTEDGLRAFRALRFIITKGLKCVSELEEALNSDWLIEVIKNISVDRIRQEMHRCFEFNTLDTILTLEKYPKIRNYMFTILWLEPTTKKRSKKSVKENMIVNNC